MRRRIRKPFYGWWIVLACSGISLYNGGSFFYGFTAFFNPIVKQFGWSYAATSLAFSLQRLQGGIAAPIVGILADRFGSRKLMVVGIVVMGLGFIAMSQMDSLATFYLTFLLTSVGSSVGSGSVGMVAVCNWFARNRGKALGVMMTGVGFAGTLVPVLTWVIGTYGWRTALIIAGVGIWVISLPLAMVVRDSPEPYGCLPDGDAPLMSDGGRQSSSLLTRPSADRVVIDEVNFDLGGALRTRAFWLLTLSLTLSHLATGALFVHEMPYFVSIGISAETGALLVMFTTVISTFGRFGFGWLGDYMDKRYVLTITYALQFVGLLAFAYAQNLWHLALFVATFGPGYGGSIPVRPALQGDYFGRGSFGAIQGIMLGVTTLGGVVGPVFAGQMYDVTGNYRLAFIILALALIPAVPATLLIKKPVAKARV